MRSVVPGLMFLFGVAWAGPPSMLHEPQMGTFEAAEPVAGGAPAFALGLAPDGRLWRGIPPAELTRRNHDGGVVWALAIDRTYALGLHAENRGDLITLRLLRLSDPNQVEPEVLHQWDPGTVDAALEPLRLWAMTTNNNRITHYAAVRADGALCYATFRRIVCFHADGRVDSALEASEIVDHIAPDVPRRDQVALFRAQGTVTGGEFYSGLGAGPDGGLYAYLHAAVAWDPAPDFPETSLRYVREVGWVIRVGLDGMVRPLSDPIVQRHAFVPGVIDETIFYPSLLRNVKHVTYVPRLDAVMAWPVEHLDFTWVDLGDSNTAGYVGPAVTPTGWSGGAGAALFPVEGEGEGYQTWREAIIRRARADRCVPDRQLNSSLGGCIGQPVAALPGADGRLGMLSAGDGGLEFRRFDFGGGQDLDGDGLAAEDEAAVGTSDWLADTDGGGVPDGMEARLLGSDPTDGDDDPGRATRGAGLHFYESSPLLQLRLPKRVAQTGTAPLMARSLSARGPLCLQGRCFDALGAVVADYSDHSQLLLDPAQAGQGETRIRVPEVKSADGRFLVLQDNSGLTRHRLADGHRALWVPWQRLTEDFPIDPEVFASAAQLKVYPVDDDRTFAVWEVGTPDEPARIVVYNAAGQGARVFDLTALCAEAGLPCRADHYDNVLRQDLALDRFETIGWSEPLQRMLVRVWTRFGMPILGVDAAGDVQRVEGVFANLAQVSAAEPWQTSPPAPAPDLFRAQAAGGTWFTGADVIDAGEAAVPAVLGVLPIHGEPFGAWGDSLLYYHYTQRAEGLFELTQMDERPRPGDVFFFAYLDGSDPQGSDRPMLFRLGRRGGIVPVWNDYVAGLGRGTGLDVDPDTTVCVADGAQVAVFEPAPGSNGRPVQERGRWPLPQVRDCQLASGQVWALVGTEVHRLNRDGFDATGETAQAFYRDSEGRPRRLAVGEDLLAALVPEGLPESVSVPEGPLVRRPDGLLFYVAPGRHGETDQRITALDPKRGRAVAVDLRRVLGPMAYSIVPGGDGEDPWARPENTGVPTAGGGGETGGSDGGVGPSADPGEGGDGGCRVAPQPGVGLWLALGLVGLRRRRGLSG